ncbi:MAG: GDSL-type esterase/lipase family protein [Akkermansiaceae bacterium]|nr:GDSL-type esterase/lipase family protein [Akkermansiaceae bacterium]
MKRPSLLPVLRILLALPLLVTLAHGQLELQKNDVVCLIGNGLGDRMQHDGWVETAIQKAHPDHQLRFRNLCFSGDMVDKRPRSKGFTPHDQYLKDIKADVIFVFFGYNESFEGEKGVGKFKQSMADMIDKYRKLKFNGDTEPRFVLFSPIAHEDLKDPNLPDGSENNQRLALYTQAIAEVAKEKKVGYVDLYTPTLKLYASNDQALTLNGIHLLPEGNRQLAEVIASALSGKKIVADESLEKVRQAVLAKNWCWHNRYRATDGNDIWGGRSNLAFVDGQKNKDVLVHELKMLDVMSANRDPAIWAALKGKAYKVDDSNVPPPVPVKSNVGGKSKSSSAKKEGSDEYISGEAGIAKMEVPEGFEVNLFADESRFPELANPVQMQVDSKGRLWAACWGTYPKWEPLKPLNDSLMIFPDDDGDGVADRAIKFATVHNPLGFEFWNGGVVVTSQPDILFLKDTDGDDVADVRIVLLQGIGSADTHHAANNLIYGPDGAIYWQSGVFLHNAHEHPWGPPLSSGASAMYRFDPRRYTISLHAMNRPNPHGIAFDRWGYHYANDGTGGKSFQVRPHKNGFKMFQMCAKEVRPVPANAIISSGNFPEELQQDFMLCNVIGYLGIKRYDLDRSGKGKRQLGEVWGEPTPDFLKSSDKNFRPSDMVFGSDGALYIADWHNIIIGHMQHNIRDPKRDKKHGRIYRMVYKERPLQEKVSVDGLPLDKLMKLLEHPVDGVRHRTRVELSERDSREVIDAAKAWIAKLDPKKPEHAHHFLEALWVHQQHNVRDTDLLATVLESPDPHVRVAAATVKHHWGPADPVSGGGGLPPEDEKEDKPEIQVPKHLTGKDAEIYRKGAEVYHREAHCGTCHQVDGKGLPNIFPPLAGSNWLDGDSERLIKITLHGLNGPIQVNGKEFGPDKGTPPMTRFNELLNDEEVAAVLTYVRNSWGNQGEVMKPETVSKVRKAHSKRFEVWDSKELLEAHPLKN